MVAASRIFTVLFTIALGAGGVSCASRQSGSRPTARPLIVSLQAEFHTQDDDKDERNGISETFTYNTKVIGENKSYQNNVRFRENSQHTGQLFMLSKEDQFPLSELTAVTYRYIMDDDDGWKVVIRIKARDSNGNEHLVAEERREIGDGKPRQGTIPLRSRL